MRTPMFILTVIKLTFVLGGQGTRSDIHALAAFAIGKMRHSEVIRQDPGTYAKYSRGIEKIMFHTQPPRTEPPVVSMYYGRTGTGKTRKVFADEIGLYRKAPDTVWFDGYYGEPCLLLDDFAGAASKMSLSYLLQLLDRYPISTQVKGGFVNLVATRIIITTNIHPRLWYDYTNREEHYQALKRRIHNVLYFAAVNTPPVKVTAESYWDDWYQACPEDTVFQTFEEDFEVLAPTRPNTPDSDEPLCPDYGSLTAPVEIT